MMASTLQHRWDLGHEPITEIARPVDDVALSTRGVGLPLACAGGLRGLPVSNPQGDVLGHVEEVMLDVQHGRIAYAVMGVGGFFGLGERYFAIPWSALVMSPAGDALRLDVVRESFTHPSVPADGEEDDATAVHSDLATSRRTAALGSYIEP